ncbi:hypothetical protein [Massilia aerilata]|uniref:DUF2513 domain-containing protein n=1 Tax=Massilia aerilata TaxID=453817 RepID=A0ABW0RUG4_9BURK
MEHFLAEVCKAEWNERQGGGRTWKDGIAVAIQQHPSHEANIRAYHAIGETVEILAQRRALGIRLLALTIKLQALGLPLRPG